MREPGGGFHQAADVEIFKQIRSNRFTDWWRTCVKYPIARWAMRSCSNASRLQCHTPPPAAFLFRETRRLQQSQPVLASFSVMWIVDLLAVAQRCERRQAKINADSLAGLGPSLGALSPRPVKQSTCRSWF